MPGIVNALSLVAETVSPVAEVTGTVGEGAIIPFALYFLLVSFVVAARNVRNPASRSQVDRARIGAVLPHEWLFVRPLL